MRDGGVKVGLGVDGSASTDADNLMAAVAMALAGPSRVRDLIVEGRHVVKEGRMATIDLPRVIERQNLLARRLMG